MNKFYIVDVNDIMVPFKDDLGVFGRADEITHLRSFRMDDNILWDDGERYRRSRQFEDRNVRKLGTGKTVLMVTDEGTLTEYYTGYEVKPIDARKTTDFSSNLGDCRYYKTDPIDDLTKFYVPTHLAKEVTQDKAMEVISMLFEQRRNAYSDIILPLQQRTGLLGKAKEAAKTSPVK